MALAAITMMVAAASVAAVSTTADASFISASATLITIAAAC